MKTAKAGNTGPEQGANIRGCMMLNNNFLKEDIETFCSHSFQKTEGVCTPLAPPAPLTLNAWCNVI